jgi:uncharacterized lipoprotein YmbA
VLDAVPPAGQSMVAPQSAVQVASVSIPPSLDRQEMVRKSASGHLEISDVNRWGAPLADMTQNVLTRDLTERLPAGKVIAPQITAAADTCEISVDLLEFGGEDRGDVALMGGWSLSRLGADAPDLVRNVRFKEPAAAGDYAAGAAAMSRLLGKLADDMAQTLGHEGCSDSNHERSDSNRAR